MALFTRLVDEAGSGLLLVTHSEPMAAYAQTQLRLENGRLAEAENAA